MEKIAAILFLVLFVIYGILTIYCLGKTHKLFRYLEQNEHGMWEKLGRPHLVFNNTPSLNMLFLRFLYKNQYLELANQTAINNAALIKKLSTTGLVLFPIMVTMLIIVFAN